jgi:hypothetical protein
MSSPPAQNPPGGGTDIDIQIPPPQTYEPPFVKGTTDGWPRAQTVEPPVEPHPAPQIQPRRTSGDSQNLTQDEIDQKPWKYIGYKGYSDFIASENDFLILRRFASVSARAALELQDKVVVLEEQLEGLDRELSRREMQDVNNGTFRDDIPERKRVLRELREKIMQYSRPIPNTTVLKILQ